MRTIEEIIAISKAYRAQGLLPPPLSAEERARAFGDPSRAEMEHYRNSELQWAHHVACRLEDDLFISISDKKRFNKIVREIKAELKANGRELLVKTFGPKILIEFYHPSLFAGDW
jgi:hypothetical protein